MKRCMKCGKYNVKNPNHDLCYDCFSEKEDEDEEIPAEEKFEDNLIFKEIFSVYVMFFGNGNKIGYTKDLNSRLLEIKRKYPNNKLVYIREFTKETEARRYEAWLKELSQRELNSIIALFQDKIKKIDI